MGLPKHFNNMPKLTMRAIRYGQTDGLKELCLGSQEGWGQWTVYNISPQSLYALLFVCLTRGGGAFIEF